MRCYSWFSHKNLTLYYTHDLGHKHKNNIFLLISKVMVRSDEPCHIHENNNFICKEIIENQKMVLIKSWRERNTWLKKIRCKRVDITYCSELEIHVLLPDNFQGRIYPLTTFSWVPAQSSKRRTLSSTVMLVSGSGGPSRESLGSGRPSRVSLAYCRSLSCAATSVRVLEISLAFSDIG